VAVVAQRFLVTDHGCQFRAWFKRLVEKRGIALVKERTESKTGYSVLASIPNRSRMENGLRFVFVFNCTSR